MGLSTPILQELRKILIRGYDKDLTSDQILSLARELAEFRQAQGVSDKELYRVVVQLENNRAGRIPDVLGVD